jgi:hypothetical protein
MIGYGPDSKRIWTLDESFSMLAIHPAKTSAAGFYFPGESIKQPVSTVLKVLTDLWTSPMVLCFLFFVARQSGTSGPITDYVGVYKPIARVLILRSSNAAFCLK